VEDTVAVRVGVRRGVGVWEGVCVTAAVPLGDSEAVSEPVPNDVRVPE
jgi:hypothetical protein